MPQTLYDQDFYAWTQQQAGFLKTGQLTKLDVDYLESAHLLQPIDFKI